MTWNLSIDPADTQLQSALTVKMHGLECRHRWLSAGESVQQTINREKKHKVGLHIVMWCSQDFPKRPALLACNPKCTELAG